MKRLKNFFPILVLFSVFLTPPSLSAAEKLTLEEAYNKALSQSPQILANRERTKSTKASVERARGVLLPTLDLSESYLRTNDPVLVFGAKLQQGKFTQQDFDINALNNPTGINNWRTRWEVNAPVFHSGVNWARLRAAKEHSKAQGHMEDFQKRKIKLAVTQLYYQSIGLKRQQEILQSGIRQIRGIENGYQPIQAPTSGSSSDFLGAKMIRTHLESQVIKLEEEARQAERNLNVFLGQDPDTPLNLVDPLPPLKKIKVEEAEYIPEREDILASKAKIRAAQANRDAAFRRFGPRVDFFGAYNIFTGNFDDYKDSYEVGGRLTLPLFNWDRHANMQKVKADLAQAKHEKHAIELKSKAERQNSFSNLKSLRKQYQILQRNAQIASRALNLARERYHQGSLSLTQYAEVLQNLVRSKMSLIGTHMQIAAAEAEHQFQLGNL